MKNDIPYTRNENGSILVVTIMVMILMSIVGFTTIRRSTVESEISGNHLL
jgi:Tfp pilus assembly protein PilX